MRSGSKKLELGIVIAALVILIVIWAMNGYEDTWMYLAAIIVAIPASWFFFGKK